jgi:serine/threonine protein kinase
MKKSDWIHNYRLMSSNAQFICMQLTLHFRILSDGQFESHLYLVLPFYDQGTLQSYLRTSYRTLTMNQCLLFCRSLASAMTYLHLGHNSAGATIVHRDIKSSNILVCPNGLNLCLTDFGIATALPCVLTEKYFVKIGTERYMSPELLEGVIAHTREALCSVDIYGLALVMWEIISQCDVYTTTGMSRLQSINHCRYFI